MANLFPPFVAQAQSKQPWSKKPALQVDFDMETIPEPQQVDTGYLFDFIDGTMFQQVKQTFDFPRNFRALAGKPKESLNVNSLDEVPDSSWFTSRNGRRVMTLEEIKRGPDVTTGPQGKMLTVTRGKSSGITPGFTIKDEAGDTYLLKFDPPQFPELSSGAEVIATKLFYAAGYNVPQNTIYRFRREQLQVDPKARFTDPEGNRRALTDADIEMLLKQAARMPDGSYRCLASKLLSGKPKGGFYFLGMRKDDANDIMPHEHRRDVRALRVFCAWLSHNDIRVGNTLDMFVTEQGRSFLRHYLIDFGSTLGSDTVFPNLREVGNEYQIDGGEAAKTFFSLGIYQRPWYNKNFDPIVSPAVGVFSVKHFQPRGWKQNFPLVAFENMTEHDARWAAEIVASFTDEQIRAVVELAEYSNPADADYVAKTIIARRDKIAKAWLPNGSGIGKAKLERAGEQHILSFRDYRDGEDSDFEYEVRTVDSSRTVLTKGRLREPRLAFDATLVSRISQAGKTADERGVVQLILKRSGEKKAAHLWLFADSAASLRLIGARWNV